jgi:hypothetical protein
MLAQLLLKIGDFWAGLSFAKLNEMARIAEQRALRAVHAATEAERLSRSEFSLERAIRSRQALLHALVKLDNVSSIRLVQKANRDYFAVIEALCFLLSWRAPVYRSRRTRVPLRRFVRAVARAMVARDYALRTQLQVVTNSVALVDHWSGLDLAVNVLPEPDLNSARKYRGVVYYHELAVSTEMSDLARRSAWYAQKVETLIESLKPHSSDEPCDARAALLAVEREFSSRAASAAREIKFWSQVIHSLHLQFCNLEIQGKILPQYRAEVVRARLLIANAVKQSNLGLGAALEFELSAVERMKGLLDGACFVLDMSP